MVLFSSKNIRVYWIRVCILPQTPSPINLSKGATQIAKSHVTFGYLASMRKSTGGEKEAILHITNGGKSVTMEPATVIPIPTFMEEHHDDE